MPDASDSPTPRLTVREAVHDVLREHALTTVFGNPGSTELPMFRDFPADFDYVLGLQEAVVVAMADGFARGTGGAVLVNLHTAAGLGNGMGAIITAHLGYSPLVVTAGQQDRRMLESEPFLSGRLVEIARPYVKWAHEPARPQDVPAALDRAVHTALQAPRGPVFLSVPMDDWGAEASAPRPRRISHRAAPDPVALDAVAELLERARRPAFVAGSEVAVTGGWDDLVGLAERLRAAVWTEPYGPQAGFPTDHDLHQGRLPFAEGPLLKRLAAYDVVLVVGAPAFLYDPYVPGPPLPEDTRVVQLTDDPGRASRGVADVSVVGDVGLTVRALLERTREADRPPPGRRPAAPAPEATDPMTSDFVLHALAERLPADAILVEEAPSTKAVFDARMTIRAPDGYHTTASGGLGYAMPASVGLKLSQPGRTVVCVIGEGSAMYSIQALWTAAQHGAAVLWVLLNNSQYGILKGFAELLDVGTGLPGLEVPGLDPVALARGFGCAGRRVERADELAGALDEGLRAGRPYLLEVAVLRETPSLA